MRVLVTEVYKMILHLLVILLPVWDVLGSGVTVGITPYSHPIQNQYHAQDVLGQYAYGYATPTSTKSETKTADGVTRGGYSYLDSNEILQTVEYFADPIHGFRVRATNLPQDLPEVAYAKAQHLAQFQATQAERAAIAAQVQASVQHVPSLPAPVQDLPEVVNARAAHLAEFEAVKARDLSQINQVVISPVDISHATYATPSYVRNNLYSYVPALQFQHAPISSQYHTQDGLGQYSYGYVGGLSSKSETKTLDGITRGGYSYMDANGIVQSVNYISDPVNGFRVAATNLPVAPKVILRGAVASANVVGPVDASASVVPAANAKLVLQQPDLYTHNVLY